MSAKSIIQNLAENLKTAVKEDAKAEKGATNRSVDFFLSNIAPNYYKGTFAADTISYDLVNSIYSIVVNLQPSVQINQFQSGHFVAIVAKKNYILYLDPFALPCIQNDVVLFLKSDLRPIYFNTTRIQDFFSVFCPMYCILFVTYFDSEREWKMRFETNLKKNEKICVRYLNKILK